MNPLTQTINGNNNIMNIVKMLQGGNPEKIAMNLMQQNPQFKQFINANKGKTPEQVAQEHGIDLQQFKNMFG